MGAVQSYLQWDPMVLEPVFRGLYTLAMQKKQAKDFIPMLYNVDSSDKAMESFDGAGGEGLMVPWKDSNNQVAYGSIQELWTKQFIHQKFSLGREIDRDLIDDLKLAQLKTKITSMADAVYKTQQMQAVEIFNNAFTTNGVNYLGRNYNSSGVDGVPLCSTSHPYSPANTVDTQSNTGTQELSIDAWDDTNVAMQEWVDDRGVTMATVPDTLVVAPYNARVAMQIAGIPGQGQGYEPGSADFNVNVYQGHVKVIVNPFLKNRKAWFAIDSGKSDEYLKWFWRRKAEEGTISDFDTEVTKFKVVGRWSYGFMSPWFAYGHNPS